MLRPAVEDFRARHRGDLTIERDAECLSCGYNLRGLTIGSACPECGAEIVLASSASDDPLNEMSNEILATFLRGALAGSVTLAALVGLLSVTISGWIEEARTFWSIGFVIGGAWLLTTWWLTPSFRHPAARRFGFSATSRRRHFARWLQTGWLVCALALVARESVGNLNDFVTIMLDLIALSGALAALIGLMILATILENLAQWARDDTAEFWLNLLFWGPPLYFIGRGLALVVGLIWADAPFAMILMMVGWITAAMGVFLIVSGFAVGMTLIARTIGMSILHALEFRARAARREERRREHAEELQRHIKQIDASSTPLRAERRR